MPELHLRADLGEAAQVGRRQAGVRIDAQLPGRAPQQGFLGGGRRVLAATASSSLRLWRQPA